MRYLALLAFLVAACQTNGKTDTAGDGDCVYYLDGDNDGYGNLQNALQTACGTVPSGYSASNDDCDDADPGIHPDAEELCDGLDNDCDEEVDDGVLTRWYADADNDGFGRMDTSTEACDKPDAHVPVAGDCDDGDPAIFPGAEEICDGLDNDCDGGVDDGAGGSSAWYADLDGDGYGDPSLAAAGCTAPAGYVADGTDCNDDAAGIHPEAAEACDGLDNDCDGTVDEDVTEVWFADADDDDWGDADLPVDDCNPGPGYAPSPGDCDDHNSDIHPDALEVCDRLDNDCDWLVDDADPDIGGLLAWYVDADGDGWGVDGEVVTGCEAPAGAASTVGDCDDTNASIHPDATEICDGLDNDCDALVDDADLSLEGAYTWYADGDADGWGDSATPVTACAPPAGHVEYPGDCDDTDAAYHPGAAETDCADPNDYNCDGSVGYTDADGDGYVACMECDDSVASTNPGAAELCDDQDNDCDGTVDEPDAVDASTWYADADGDSWGDPSTGTLTCDPEPGTTSDGTDCDDAQARVNPGADEVCDGLDNDCDGTVDADAIDASAWYADADGDGFGLDSSLAWDCVAPEDFVAVGSDCDDARADVNPLASELCDGLDNDCDGATDEGTGATTAWYADADGDGWGDPATSTLACVAPEGMVADGTDCDDGDATVHPEAAEACDGLDNDCDGATDEDITAVWYADGDGDGWGDADLPLADCAPGAGYAPTAGDCDDADATIHPEAEETCDGLDNDCDLLVDDADPDVTGLLSWYVDGDGDGWGTEGALAWGCAAPSGATDVAGDCDDTNASIHPEATEVCDGLDNDCDLLVDDADPSVEASWTWYADADADGWGDGATLAVACEAPAGWVDRDGDCDDANAAFNPGATETDCADPNDYNCDGSVGYTDGDGDGFSACSECNDASAAAFPGATEVCDDLDNDCDGTVDEPDAVDAAAWYTDADGDGYGDPASGAATCDPLPGATSDGTDCDDSQARVNPGATEVCDGLDNDCDGSVDGPDAADVTAWYTDADGDGFGDPSMVVFACEALEGLVSLGTDCDDSRADVNPLGTETCDGLDNDCDGTVDDAAATTGWYADADGDGYGDPRTGVLTCEPPTGFVADTSDCDDTRADVNPLATEICDGVDNDCDGSVDDGVTDLGTWFADGDGDGFGDALVAVEACVAPEGYVADATDCNDGDPMIFPAAGEACDLVDNDCDGAVDEDLALVWYADADGDGWGDAGTATPTCDPGPGFVATSGDCDDTDATVYPGAAEVCDGADNDCDGRVDDDDGDVTGLATWYTDSDADGWGDTSSVVLACVAPMGTTARAGDCDDSNAWIQPDASEVCDGLDNDCDGLVDDDDPSTGGLVPWYQDLDEDGWGDSTVVASACDAPVGFVALGGDCDDTDPAYNPGAVEDDCTDSHDYNCDGSTGYADVDADGWAACAECDDTDAAIFPGAVEMCDGADNDCDGIVDEPDAADASTWYDDADGDGYGDAATGTLTCTPDATDTVDATDCDDTQARVYPGAAEFCDGLDNDCDGVADGATAVDADVWYADVDGDGWGQDGITVWSCAAPSGFVATGGDCDDTEPDIHPMGTEVCDGLDNDCDGLTDDSSAADATLWYADLDADGYGDGLSAALACTAPVGYLADSSDCNDTNTSINPGAAEICDGLDNNCDGAIDEGSATATSWYRDADSDGYGDPASSTEACDIPSGYVADDTDCDDTEYLVNPAATEVCNDWDDDCDGLVNDADPSVVGLSTWYLDMDGDGYGVSTTTMPGCFNPVGYAALDGDCNDANASFHPDASETDCTDPNDYNCDGYVGWADDDGDGWAACAECDDGNAAVYPGATETCNGIDDDCDARIDETTSADAPTWYQDADGDGYGAAGTGTRSCTAPSGYVADATDCNDAEVRSNPGATERCDGIDNDCDGTTDESTAADATTWYRDGDGDGFGDASTGTVSCTAPTGYVSDASDCDDTRSTVSPAGTETCNSLDDDCDGSVDETGTDAATWYRDADADGYGDSSVTTRACTAPTGYVSNSLDCDDAVAAVHPSAPETCDGVDEDCDGTVDEGALDALNWYRDADRDGYGDPATSTTSCSAPSGYVSDNTDCRDTLAAVNPGATELCNSMDDDCDGSVDESSAADALTWYRDGDADGYGNPSTSTPACTAPTGYVADDTDCDDARASVYPGATERCNGIDDDCDGTTDESTSADAETWYRDADGDAWGNASSSVLACSAPSGYVADATDCDDTDASVHPTASELCNGIDDDCDGTTDESTSADAATWYRDVDGDGYGNGAVSTRSCGAPTGYVADGTDCDDANAAVNPGGTERCNGTDDDCDGSVDEVSSVDAATWYRDADGDSYGDATRTTVACAAPSGYVADDTDCNDASTAVNPSADERCNGIDDDCDGTTDESSAIDAPTWYRDVDGDGFGDLASTTRACTVPGGYVSNATDCDDTVFTIHPGGTEVCNGADDDCDGSTDEGAVDDATWYRDADGDGFGTAATHVESCTGPAGYVLDDTDCNDANAAVNPGALEVCNSIDDDCDGTTDGASAADVRTWYRDADADGYGNASTSTLSCTAPAGYVEDATDCDDARAATNPGASETCNGIDDDCDGSVDEASAIDAPTWYRDADSDGYGNAASSTVSCSAPSGYVSSSTDCNDAAVGVNPGASETCNGIDDDCDGTVDEASAIDASTWYRDSDGDGYGNASSTTRACTVPTGYVTDATDCNDSAAAVNPGATEYCNSIDDDCDGTTDEATAWDARTWYRDSDADGYGSATVTTTACSAPTGYVSDNTDCNDATSSVHPGASETCNSVDDDCDGSVDESAVDASTWYRDADSDGYGNLVSTTRSCTLPTGYVSDSTDCNDASATVHPGASETCNSIDDDCDGSVDESAVDATTWYRDADSDGYGSATSTTSSCSRPSGYVADKTDCNDASATINPGALEYCDGHDDDCDGVTDESSAVDAKTWYQDWDLDGYGNASVSTKACYEPSGYTDDSLDCDDANDDVNPAATEVCNSYDDDCDSSVDEGSVCPCATQTYGGHTYMFCSATYTWSSAQTYCHTYGYYLAAINSSAEDTWLNTTIDSYSTSKWWFGLNDITTEGTWRNDTGEAVSYTNWYTGEPNNSGNEDCAQLNRFHPSLGWNDEPCSYSFRFVCETD